MGLWLDFVSCFVDLYFCFCAGTIWFCSIKSGMFHSHLPFGREICSIKSGIFL